ncbi:MAG: alpha/beta fold hydrolase [Planctomycetes bacterium]|nr:alpha/beta fold hydrolase [Planctomycetota bacterium]
MKTRIRFATNRDPQGKPVKAFGTRFNPVHPLELRFGEMRLDTGGARLPRAGTSLADVLTQQLVDGRGELEVYGEELDRDPPVLGSQRLFGELQDSMAAGRDALVYIHGYNVTFFEACASAMSLQKKLDERKTPMDVVLFSWPSDGSSTPWVAYRSDRDDAANSGLAFSRAFQKLQGFLEGLAREDYCGGSIHLVCHSMGNFVLENTLWHLRKNLPGRLPRIFGEVVLASADVDNDALEQEGKLGRLPEIARRINVYCNAGDEALRISDKTKGNPDRLGQRGPKHPMDAPAGVVNIDCSEVINGLVEHSYYLDEAIGDIAAVLRGEREDRIARRQYVASANNYRLTAKG